MELSSHEADIAIPLNATYGGHGGGNGHGHVHLIHHHEHHNHIINPPSTVNTQIPSSTTTNGGAQSTNILPSGIDHENAAAPHSIDSNLNSLKKMVRYRECLKNHAAAMGGSATDGCGEFMPSGEEGSIEALTCSACNCHRNFHRKEIEGETNNYNNNSSSCDQYLRRKVFIGHHHKSILGPESIGYPTSGGAIVASRATPQNMIMSYNMQHPSESDEQDGGSGGRAHHHHHHHHHPQALMKKRFRTKFTQEQKEKMFNFAEKVGWKIQKQEEGVVQQFCQEIGVKRRVLKVWMHNNKHNLAKINNNNNNNPSTTSTTA